MGDAMNQTETTDNQTTYYIRRLHRWRMAFFGLVILLAGTIIGAALIPILAPNRLTRPPQPPETATRMIIGRLGGELGLSPEQDEKIGPILQKHLQKLEEIRTNARSEVTEQLREMNEAVSAVLTEGQKQTWQRWLRILQWQLQPPEQGPGEGGRHRGGPQERLRRGPLSRASRPNGGPFGTERRPAGPNRPPWNDSYHRPIGKDGNTLNE